MFWAVYESWVHNLFVFGSDSRIDPILDFFIRLKALVSQFTSHGSKQLTVRGTNVYKVRWVGWRFQLAGFKHVLTKFRSYSREQLWKKTLYRAACCTADFCFLMFYSNSYIVVDVDLLWMFHLVGTIYNKLSQVFPGNVQYGLGDGKCRSGVDLDTQPESRHDVLRLGPSQWTNISSPITTQFQNMLWFYLWSNCSQIIKCRSNLLISRPISLYRSQTCDLETFWNIILGLYWECKFLLSLTQLFPS